MSLPPLAIQCSYMLYKTYPVFSHRLINVDAVAHIPLKQTYFRRHGLVRQFHQYCTVALIIISKSNYAAS